MLTLSLAAALLGCALLATELPVASSSSNRSNLLLLGINVNASVSSAAPAAPLLPRLLGAGAPTTTIIAHHGGACSARSGNPDVVPCLKVPPCPRQAVIRRFYLSDPSVGLLPPRQATSVSVCWGAAGLIVRTNATDADIWSRAAKCNAAVFSQGDTLEVFAGAVQYATDDPRSYLEIDAGSGGALWGSRSLNSKGNVSNCGPKQPKECPAGRLNCTGLSDFGKDGPSVAVTTGHHWWADVLTVPWALFHEPFVRSSAKKGVHPPWRLFRMNFYRYDYPYKNTAPGGSWNHSTKRGYELSGWSPTHVRAGPFPSWDRSILTDIYLCHACSDHFEIEDGNGADRSSTASTSLHASVSWSSWTEGTAACRMGCLTMYSATILIYGGPRFLRQHGPAIAPGFLGSAAFSEAVWAVGPHIPVQAFPSSVFRDKNRCDIGKSQSKRTAKDETPGGPMHPTASIGTASAAASEISPCDVPSRKNSSDMLECRVTDTLLPAPKLRPYAEPGEWVEFAARKRPLAR
jgi:hypothetical protein